MFSGYLAVIIAAICLGIMPGMQKQLLIDGLSMNSLQFFTSAMVVLFCAGLIKIKGIRARVSGRQFGQAVMMGLFGMILTPILLNRSYFYLPVGTATMLNFLYPAVVCVFMGLLFHRRVSLPQIIAILISFAGLMLLTGGGKNISKKGAVLAVLSAFTYGIFLAANEKGGVNQLPLEVKLFFVALPAVVFFSVAAVLGTGIDIPRNGAAGWLRLIVGSGMFFIGGYFLIMYGVKKIGASKAAFASLAEPLVSMIFGSVWFGDKVSFSMIIGAGLILTSILCISLDSRLTAALTEIKFKMKKSR